MISNDEDVLCYVKRETDLVNQLFHLSLCVSGAPWRDAELGQLTTHVPHQLVDLWGNIRGSDL